MSFCECDYDDLPSVHDVREHKARKEHICSECGKKIMPGETYRYIFGVWHNEPDVFKHCEACADLWDSFKELGYCTVYGELKELHREYKNMLTDMN